MPMIRVSTKRGKYTQPPKTIKTKRDKKKDGTSAPAAAGADDKFPNSQGGRPSLTDQRSSSRSLYSGERVFQAIEDMVEELQQDSLFFRCHPAATLPVIEPRDLFTGADMLSETKETRVFEVTAIQATSLAPSITRRMANKSLSSRLYSSSQLSKQISSEGDDTRDELKRMLSGVAVSIKKDDSFDSSRRRNVSSQRLFSNRESQFVIKKVKSELSGRAKYDARLYLAKESLFLASLASLPHQNVCTMYGTVGVPGLSNFKIIIDRPDKVLMQQLDEWRTQMELAQKPWPWGIRHPDKVPRTAKARQLFLHQRLTLALHIAEGLNFLHDYKLMYRDLSPSKIGVYDGGTAKLSDFGFLRELKSKDYSLNKSLRFNTDGEQYRLTPRVGTRQFMAPEVFWGQPYGLKADVYSFGILLNCMLVLEMPFPELTAQDHAYNVVQRGERPRMPNRLDSSLKRLIRQCWHAQSSQRPTMQEVCSRLQAFFVPTKSNHTACTTSMKDSLASLRGEGQDTSRHPSQSARSLTEANSTIGESHSVATEDGSSASSSNDTNNAEKCSEPVADKHTTATTSQQSLTAVDSGVAEPQTVCSCGDAGGYDDEEDDVSAEERPKIQSCEKPGRGTNDNDNAL